MEKTVPEKRNKSHIILTCLLGLVFLMLLLLLGIYYLNTNKVIIAKDIGKTGYSLRYDTKELEHKRVLLSGSSTEKIYMDRFSVPKSNDLFYLSVSGIDAATDLDEALESFESDESYSFTREDAVTFGAGDYVARRISYVDHSGTVPVTVYYYYDEADGLFITVCTDEAHRAVLEAALARIKVEQ